MPTDDKTAGVSDTLARTPLPDEAPPPSPEPETPKADATDAGKTDKSGAEPDDDPDGEEDPEKAGATAEQAGTGEDHKPRQKRPGKYQRQLIRQGAEIEALRSTVETLTRSLVRPPQQGDTPASAEKTAALAPPKESDYETHEDYTRALVDWQVRENVARELAKREEDWNKRQVAAQEHQRIKSVKEKIEAGRQKYDDFDDVAMAAELPLSDSMLSVMEDSPHFADIAYHLGSNPDEAARIARLSPSAAAREIGKIEYLVANPPPRKTATSAPAPVKTVVGAATPEKDPSKMTMSEYRKWREGKPA